MAGYRDAHAKRYILHDIYKNGTGGTGENGAMRSLAKLRTGTYCIAAHRGHSHVLHTCDYNNSTCRCYLAKILRGRFGKWLTRKCSSTRNLSIQRWRAFAIYMSSGTRSILKINNSGGNWLRGGQNRAIPLYGGGQRRSAELVEGGPDQSSHPLQWTSRPGSTGDKTHFGQEGERGCGNGGDGEEGCQSGVSRGTQRSHKGEQILAMIMSSTVTPLARFFDSHLWLESHYRSMPNDQKSLRQALKLAQYSISKMSLTQIFNHVNRIDTNKLLFASDTPSEYYFGIIKSFDVCMELLSWQMGFENIKHFLQDIFDVLEKVRPKVNTLFILGAPNSGKNFFFDSVIHLMINYGQMGNFTRHDNFPLQECVQRRVIL
ncbi:unnamed protein product [Bemisia tabaci]|uniref:Non-capsid protein NS-1 n=1 Tax=Bemisia tabaci TaxID=7038 RepID=A0A9P0FA42_BEMTA|nr:unnamed protein product [Bemisia tabaci]